MVYCTDRSKAVVPVLVLLLFALLFILRGDLFYVLPCVILFLCFQSFWHWDNLAWGREILVFFVRFALVWFCLFPLPLGVWEGLRFVIVALPGLSPIFLAHLSRRLKVSYCDHSPSVVVVVVVCPSTIFKQHLLLNH